MIRLSAPTDDVLTTVARSAAAAAPTHPADVAFEPFEYEQTVGHGTASFEVGRQAITNWQMHRDAGVRVQPVPIAVGNDVVMWTRSLGLTLVFSCRITATIDDDNNFGFTYATLPGHPAQGVETFRLELINDVVQLHIEGESRPAIWLNKLAGPVGKILQRQATERYITSLRTTIRNAL